MAQNDETYTAQVLIADDEEDHAEVMAEALRRLGHICTLVYDLDSAVDELRHGRFDLVVTDLVMEVEDAGQQILATANQTQPQAETILVTAHGDVPTAKAAIKGGAYDFIEKPIDLDVFRTLCDHAIQAVMLRQRNTDLEEQLDEQYGFEGIVGNSSEMRQAVRTVKQVSPSDIPVLVTGESGTGKELIAHAIHQNSPRAGKTFKPINCAGLTESILESELFGHIRGAFTGADRDRQGVFEFADKGTLFLDEIGDMPLSMQAKLLRVLETGEIVRVGSNESRTVDVRLVAATNRDLEKKIESGDFREDLYFRIKGVEIHLPPLRERREDIIALAHHFVSNFATKLNRDAPELAEDAQRLVMQFDWPGNVRQLMNVMQNLVVMVEGDRIEPHHLPKEIRETDPASESEGPFPSGLTLEQLEKQAIRNALRLTQGNREQAAKMLDIGERTLYRKLKEYGLK